MLFRFLKRFPTAATVATTSVEEVTRFVAPLGLHKQRPIAIIRFSRRLNDGGHSSAFSPATVEAFPIA